MSNSSNHPETLVDVSLSHLETRGEHPFLIWLGNGSDESQRYTFASLDRQARCLAVQLGDALRARTKLVQSPGAQPAVLIVLQHGPEFAVAFFACLYAGMAAVPVYAPKKSESGERLLSVIEDSGASLVITNLSLMGQLRALGLGDQETLIPVEEIDDALAIRWTRPAIDADSVAFIQYTSGSTGTPKGVEVTHGNVLSNERMIGQVFDGGPSPVVVGWLPMFHDTGLVGNLLHPFYLGVRTVLMSPLTFVVRPIRWLEAITRYRGTLSGGPNFGYELCLARITKEQRQKLDLSSWRVAFNGAEPVRASTLARFSEQFSEAGFDRNAFCPCYGMAECSLLVTGIKRNGYPSVLPVHREQLARGKVFVVGGADGDHDGSFESSRSVNELVSSGSTPDGCDAKIVDATTGEELGEDQIGEIWIRGPHVARGYKNQQLVSEDTFGASVRGDSSGRRFLRSGDLGFLHREELFVTGRIKDVIIVAGRNHYPQDIEASALASLPALGEGVAAAFSVDRGVVERVVLVLWLPKRVARELSLSAVSRAVISRVTRNHSIELDDLVIVTARLPTTSSNKIQRSQCRRIYQNEGFPETCFSTRQERIRAAASSASCEGA